MREDSYVAQDATSSTGSDETTGQGPGDTLDEQTQQVDNPGDGDQHDDADTRDDDEQGDDQQDTDPRVKRANRDAARYRRELRETQQQLQQQGDVLDRLRRAITGDDGDSDADPAEQLQTVTAEAEQLRADVTDLRGALLVHELAPEAGGNPVALLDSRRFTESLRGLDPAADDYREQVADAIKVAVESNTTLRAAGQGPGRGGADNAGQGSGSGAAVTPEQFAAFSYKERTDLFRTNPSLYRKLAGTAS